MTIPLFRARSAPQPSFVYPRLPAVAPRTEAVDGTGLTRAFDAKFFRAGELPYFRIRFEDIPWNLEPGTDLSNAWDVFYRWGHHLEKHETTLNGEKVYAIRWTRGNAGGVELFDSAGSRFASKEWGRPARLKAGRWGPTAPRTTEQKPSSTSATQIRFLPALPAGKRRRRRRRRQRTSMRSGTGCQDSAFGRTRCRTRSEPSWSRTFRVEPKPCSRFTRRTAHPRVLRGVHALRRQQLRRDDGDGHWRGWHGSVAGPLGGAGAGRPLTPAQA